MTDDKILQMVSELVEFIDYDLWKDMFGDENLIVEDSDILIDIVRRHLCPKR